MNQNEFWELIQRAGLSEIDDPYAWDELLQIELKKLAVNEIVEWNHIFDQYAKDVYTIDMWGAAYLINGGASDDGFYYFRCWLIGMGKEIYEAAAANPDTLADVVNPDAEAEAEIYAAAHQAWMEVAGKTYDDPYPARKESAELRGDEWDYDDDLEMRKRFPRLSELFLD